MRKTHDWKRIDATFHENKTTRAQAFICWYSDKPGSPTYWQIQVFPIYAKRPWTMKCFASLPTAKKHADRMLALLEKEHTP